MSVSRYMVFVVACLWRIACAGDAEATELLGPNRVPHGGFETASGTGLPKGWRVLDKGCAGSYVKIDRAEALAGTASLSVYLPLTGDYQIASPRMPVEGGKRYLFSVGFRTRGFGERGYSGVASSTSVVWYDASGKGLGRDSLAFPYVDRDWDLRDRFVRAPGGAAHAQITVGVSNDSLRQIKKQLAARLWLDAYQLCPYHPPPTPAYARGKTERIVEGGPDTRRVRAYFLADKRHNRLAAGRWARVVTDPAAERGTAIRADAGVGKGMMAHTAYFNALPSGLYRALLRCQVTSTAGHQKIGYFDVDSQLTGPRAVLELRPDLFRKADTYQTFEIDFVLRDAGWWDCRLMTEGTAPIVADSIKVVPLRRFSDRRLVELYPGSEGRVPAGLKVPRTGPPRGVFVAGLLWDLYRPVAAFRLTGYNSVLTPAYVAKQRHARLVGWPATAEALFENRIVYLCNLPIGDMSLRWKHLVREFVRRGGGLVVMGGHRGFARGGIRASLFEDVLPVAITADDDIVHVAGGAPIVPIATDPIVTGLPFDPRPCAYYLHRLQARPGARVVAHANGHPVIVLGQFGTGRVACIGLTPLGEPARGTMPFWRWPGWVTLLRNLSWWAMGEDDRFAASRP